MKYLELDFIISPYSRDAADILIALVADAGLESFVDTPQGVKGYVQTGLFERSVLDSLTDIFPMDGVKVTYRLAEAEDKNWNEEWERNGFEPVRIADRILIHSPEHHSLSPAEYDIVIDPHQAFGTGTHHTTGMILERLLGMDLGHKTVLDAGCGTGVLGIFCTLKGAKSVWAYDIDRWSVDNTKENMLLNGVKNMEVVEGNASILQGKDAFDLILANINRNILLADLPSFVSVMHAESQMILSGFYVEDIPLLVQKAKSLGLSYLNHTEKENWATLLFERL